MPRALFRYFLCKFSRAPRNKCEMCWNGLNITTVWVALRMLFRQISWQTDTNRRSGFIYNSPSPKRAKKKIKAKGTSLLLKCWKITAMKRTILFMEFRETKINNTKVLLFLLLFFAFAPFHSMVEEEKLSMVENQSKFHTFLWREFPSFACLTLFFAGGFYCTRKQTHREIWMAWKLLSYCAAERSIIIIFVYSNS